MSRHLNWLYVLEGWCRALTSEAPFAVDPDRSS